MATVASNCSESAAKRVRLDGVECNSESAPCNYMNETHIDQEYFSSYADTSVHRTMIEDSARTDTYRKAIFQKPSFVHGKVVCDVGCGSGILSLFCAQAGAKKVYAIEASRIARNAKLVVEENGFSDVITIYEGRAEDVVLPEKVDVIVSEWMGYMMLYETMLPSVLHIRDKWLKPDGLLFPSRAVLKVSMGEAPFITEYEEGTYDFWMSLNPMYDLNMVSIADDAVNSYKSYAHIAMLSQKDVASLPATICDLDLNEITPKQLETIHSTFTLKSMGSRRLNSLICWFDVMFPGDITLSTSPFSEETHWRNTVLALPDKNLKQDTEINCKIFIKQHMKRSLDVRLIYSIDGDEEKVKRYRLDEAALDAE